MRRACNHHSFMIHGSLAAISLSNIETFAHRGRASAGSFCAIDATLAVANHIVYIRVVNKYTRISYQVRKHQQKQVSPCKIRDF